jgi:hypothetical protein
MALNKAVGKLHHDLGQLHKAEAAEKKAEAAQKKAAASEKTALAGIQAQEKGLIDQFVSVGSAQDPAQRGKVLNQLFGLGEKEVQTQDKFTKAIAADKAALSKDKKAVSADHKRALADLKPAEFHLSLKDTNSARKQLGLKALKKPVRAPSASPSHVTPTMRRLAQDARSVAMGMGGFTSHGLCATGVSRTLREAMGITVTGNGNQIDENLPRSKFKQIHIPLAQALKIPGLVLTWEHTSTPEGRIFGHTAITLGNGKESASDFVEFDTLSAAQSRSGLKIFMPTV